MADSNLKNALQSTINLIQEKPAKAQVQFKSETELVNGLLCKANIRQFSFTVDEPQSLGGNDTAPNPVEFVLAALGTCQEILYGVYAEFFGVKLDSVKVIAKGDLNLKGLFGLDENVPAGFQHVYYETEIKSRTERNLIEKLVETVEKNCPLLDILTRSIKVGGKVNILEPVAA